MSLSLDAVRQFAKDGCQAYVYVEAGAGQICDMRDARFDESGAIDGTRGDVISKSSVLISIHPPVEDFVSLSGKAVVSWVGRLTDVGKDRSGESCSVRHHVD